MEFHMLDERQVVMRLLISALLGACIGFEREKRNQPAGLRTHTILSVGSALAMCISIDLAIQFRTMAPNGDPARLAAQVISGIGFLGAGAILKFGASIKGLTTATSLWTVAIIGPAVGAGHFFAATATTLLLLFVLILLNTFEKKFVVETVTRSIRLKARDHENLVHDLKEMFRSHDIEIKSISCAKNVESREIEITAFAAVSNRQDMDELIGTLSRRGEIISFSVE